MKECKIIHINDGKPQELSNGNWFYAENYPRAEDALNEYLNQGYEVKQMVPLVAPGTAGAKSLPFYNDGFVFYLEREIPDADEEEFLDAETQEELARIWESMEGALEDQ